jgi:steroid delta-isomerase-like uncharacterized protein
MSTLTNKAIVRRMIEKVWNERQLDLIEEFFTDDVIHHTVGYPSSSGLAAVKETTGMTLSGFPDLRLTIEDDIADGDKVAARWTMTGTQKSELFGIPATDKQVTQSGMTFYRLSNAKIDDATAWRHPCTRRGLLIGDQDQPERENRISH